MKDLESIVNKQVDETLSQTTLQNMLEEIEKSQFNNNVSLSADEAQFLADLSVIVTKYAVKNAVVATINSINEFNS
jgi:hypothetical protein